MHKDKTHPPKESCRVSSQVGDNNTRMNGNRYKPFIIESSVELIRKQDVSLGWFEFYSIVIVVHSPVCSDHSIETSRLTQPTKS